MPCSQFWRLTRQTTCKSLKGRNSISLRGHFGQPLGPLKMNPKLCWEEEQFMEKARPGKTALYSLTMNGHIKLHVLVPGCALYSVSCPARADKTPSSHTGPQRGKDPVAWCIPAVTGEEGRINLTLQPVQQRPSGLGCLSFFICLSLRL